MPKYDYRCGTCGLVYEKREGFEAPSLQECPECRGQARRVLTPPAIVFKGSGWYVTDSRKSAAPSDSGGTDGAKSEKPDKAAPAAAKSEKAESKSSSAPAAAAAD